MSIASVLNQRLGSRRASIGIVVGLTLCWPLALSACRSGGDRTQTSQTESAGQSTHVEGRAEHFGAPLRDVEITQLAKLLAEPAAYSGTTLVTEGYVRRACSRKGCWMELATGAAPDEAGCRVTFKDYAFFVPTDSAGSRARIDGELRVQRIPPARVAHYEAEGAVFKNKLADGSASEVSFVASGVDLRR